MSIPLKINPLGINPSIYISSPLIGKGTQSDPITLSFNPVYFTVDNDTNQLNINAVNIALKQDLNSYVPISGGYMNGMLYVTSGGIRTVDQIAIGAPQETNEDEGGQLSLLGTKTSDGYMIDQIPGQNKYGCLRFFSDASISKEPTQTITFTYNNFNSPVLSIGDRDGGTDSRLYVRDIEGIKLGEDQAQLYLNFENRNGTINYGPISIISPSLTESRHTQLRISSDDNLSGGLLLQNYAVTEEQPNEGFQLVQFNSIGEKGVIDFLFNQNNPFINLFYTINCYNAATFLEGATFNKGIYLNTAPSANYNFTLNTHVNKNESQLVCSITNNDKASSYTEWFFRDNTYTQYRHELNGGNGILTQFDLVSGEDENDNTSYANFNCKVISQNEYISTHHESYRIAYGTYGTFWKNDGTNLNLLITNENDQYGSYNDFRPYTVNLSTGQVILNNSFIINSDGYTSIANNLTISTSGITANTGISVNGIIDGQHIVNAKTFFRKTSTILNKNNTYAQNTYDNDLIFADSENKTIFRIDTFLGPTNNTGARLLAQSRDSSVEAELALRWRENNTPVVTWSYPTYGESNELARCDWVQNQIYSISAQDIITVYNGKTGIINNDSTDTSWLKILFKKSGNSGIIYGYAELSKDACAFLKNNRLNLTNAHPITLSTKLYGYLPLTYTNQASELLTYTLPYYYNSSESTYSSYSTDVRRFVFGLSSTGDFLMSSSGFNGTNMSSNDIIFIQFIGLCHI